MAKFRKRFDMGPVNARDTVVSDSVFIFLSAVPNPPLAPACHPTRSGGEIVARIVITATSHCLSYDAVLKLHDAAVLIRYRQRHISANIVVVGRRSTHSLPRLPPHPPQGNQDSQHRHKSLFVILRCVEVA